MARKTIVVTDDLAGPVNEAAAALEAGGIVVFPTETVYGIGVLDNRPEAVERLRELKERPAHKPFQMLVDDIEAARRYGAVFSKHARNLANAFWPGPLTLVVPDGTGSGTLGIRIPDSPFMLALCRKVGRPIITSSANKAGAEPPMDAAAADVFGDAVDLLIDGGGLVEGVPSTVVECREDGFTILRDGDIDREAIASAWMA